MDGVTFIKMLQDLLPNFEGNIRSTLLYYIRRADNGLYNLTISNLSDNRKDETSNCFNNQLFDQLISKCYEFTKAFHKIATYYYVYKLYNVNQFNFNSVIKKIEYSDVGEVFTQNASLVSNLLVKAVVRQVYDLRLITRKDFISICQHLCSKECITNLFSGEVSGNNKLGRVIWSVLNSYDDVMPTEDFAKISSVKREWLSANKDIAQEFFNLNWLGLYETIDILDKDLKSDLEKDLAKKGRVESTETIKTSTDCYGVHAYHMPCKRTYYGENIEKWLESSTGPKYYGLCTTVELINYNEVEVHETSSGCVIGGTLITLSDGTTKRIEEIVENDAVLSKDGMISVCSDELVKTPHIQTIYGINDEPACFTTEHALWTPEGWKSLDPEKSNRINPHFNVTLLKCGDSVYKLCGFKKGAPNIQLTEVKRIHLHDVSQEHICGYDLHFREGVPSYFANNVLCLLNYPEITAARIGKNMEHNMTEEERTTFMKIIGNNKVLFEKAFGTFAVNGFFNSMYNS